MRNQSLSAYSQQRPNNKDRLFGKNPQQEKFSALRAFASDQLSKYII